MSFPKANEKRFNEIEKCTPSPTRYFPGNPRINPIKKSSPQIEVRSQPQRPLQQASNVDQDKLERQRLVMEVHFLKATIKDLQFELKEKNKRNEELEREHAILKNQLGVGVTVADKANNNNIPVQEVRVFYRAE